MSGPALVPHFDEDVEMALAACVLLDAPATLRACDRTRLTGHDFADPRCGLVYRVARKLADQGVGIDVVTVGRTLERYGNLEQAGGREFLGALLQFVPHAGNAHAYAVMVHNAALGRRQTGADVAADTAARQVGEAQRFLDLEAGDFLRFPWPTLDAAWGGLMPGTLSFLAGHPGGGKTSFALSLIDRLVASGKRVLYAGLETRPNVLRTQMAARVLGMDPNPILRGDAQREADWPERRARLREEVQRQREDPAFTDHLRFSGHEALDIKAAVQLMDEGRDFAADLVVVDHIDHVRGDGKLPVYAESRAIVEVLDTQSKRGNLRTLAMTQTNNEGEAMDPTVPHRPLSPKQIYMGKHKEQVAHWFLAVYRPLDPGHTKDDLIDVRSGRKPITDILAVGATMVQTLKNRVGGDRKPLVELGFWSGAILDRPPLGGALRHGHTSAA